MECPACKIDPTTHSFVYMGIQDGLKHYYTSPAQAKGSEPTDIRTSNFKKHVDKALGEPWVWIFDCKDMTFRDYTSIEFTLNLAHIFEDEHSEWLKKIVIVNPNMWVTGMIAFLKTVLRSTLLDKVTCSP
uniref:CRAL-TRIO domain-containing protein n=1 Tax=viral metagenome TaxID=1070528 RepID=A0A6C0AJM0_9ZZZZ